MKIEYRDMDGRGCQPHEVYDMPLPASDQVRSTYCWEAVTDVPCPVEGCGQTVVWYEAGCVPGYRVCMRRLQDGTCDPDTLRHRLQASGTIEAPTLINYDYAPDGAEEEK